MRLINDWRRVLRKAWSFRLFTASCLFTVAEIVLPLYSDKFPRNVFAVLSVVTAVGGLVMRVLAQKDMK